MFDTENKPNLRTSSIIAHDEMTRLLPLETEEPAEIDGLDLALVLLRRKKQILLVTAAVVALAAVAAFVIPSMYTGTTVILPPQQSQSAASSIFGQIGAIAALSGQDWGLKNPADLFVQMLQSRTIADHLIDRFDLREVYRVKTYQAARKQLAGRSKIDAGDESLITISVSDRDPGRAAEIANGYVEELHALDANMGIGEAAQRRLFYEQKMDSEREALAQAEVALKQVEEKSGFVEPTAQAKALIEAVADMRAKVVMEEAQLQSMRTFATKNNPDLKSAEQRLAVMRGELSQLEKSSGGPSGADSRISTRRLPQAQLEYVRRARDLKYHEALYEFLGKQLEAARIDEAKNAVVIQVVDKAVRPERRSSPRRLLKSVLLLWLGFSSPACGCSWRKHFAASSRIPTSANVSHCCGSPYDSLRK
jgi:tyrosine-protein kinase Etk/Wzc